MTQTKLSIKGTSQLPNNSRLAIGVFDGIHKGHQLLLDQADFALTFSPHPDIITQQNPKLLYLSTPEEFNKLYPKNLCIHFNQDVMKLEPLAFLEQLFSQLKPLKKIVVGEDFRFGAKAKGDISLLKSTCKKQNIELTVTSLLKNASGIPIKSGRIRHLLDTDPNTAFEELGHPYLMIGKVVSGEKRGKLLGYPTANLLLPKRKCIPQTGVYKGYVGAKKPAIIYIGSKPTFQGTKLGVEVHLLDSSENLYNKRLAVSLEQKIRDELKFERAQRLQAQIKADIKKWF